jgi:plastocyanin
MNRFRALPRTRRAPLAAAALAVSLLVAAAGVALAAGSVSIAESGGQYHFQPATINVTAGSSVTWTNNSDAPHTVSSDTSGGPLAGSVLPDATYTATFNKAGDFAYHCNIHSYMHGTVHVAALPGTDSVTSAATTGTNSGVLLGLAALGSLFAVGGFALRLRRREVRD